MNNVGKTLTYVRRALDKLRLCFLDEAELTFIMRVPGDPDAYMVVTNDDPAEVRAVLTRALNKNQHWHSITVSKG